MIKKAVFTLLAAVAFCTGASAQKYKYIDKTVAVVGNEAILISDIESAVKDRSAQGYSSDRNVRCEVLEQILESKLFLMQARIDSLTVDNNMVENGISQQADRMLTYLGGEDKVEEYFGKPLYRLRQEWRKQYEEMSLTQQEQSTIMEKIPDMTPYDVKEYLDTVDKKNLPIIPIKYKLSQICIYPDPREDHQRREVLDPGQDLFRGPGQRPPRRRAGNGFQINILACLLGCRYGPETWRNIPDRGDPGWIPYHRSH